MRLRLPRLLPILLLLAGFVSEAGRPAATARVRDVALIGTAFRITLDDDQVLEGDRLIGAVLETADTEGNPLTIRIDGHQLDPLDPTGETVLYALSAPDPATGIWRQLCEPGPDGLRMGFPLAGAWTTTGEHAPAPGSFSITCTAGAIGKCVRFGYRPWRTAPNGRVLWDYHQACVRMMRADYCGDGVGHTRTGMPIDLYDRLGIQKNEAAPGMDFEAAWTPSGASCVRHVRIREESSLAELERRCPARLAGRTGAACTEGAAARAPDALLFNRSF
jgi:hypothetical protein